VEILFQISNDDDPRSALAISCWETLRHLTFEKSDLLQYAFGITRDRPDLLKELEIDFDQWMMKYGENESWNKIRQILRLLYGSTLRLIQQSGSLYSPSSSSSSSSLTCLPTTFTEESPHPLFEDIHITRVYQIPGASALHLQIAFIDIGRGKDLFVVEYTDYDGMEHQKYITASNSTGATKQKSIYLPCDSVTIKINSFIHPDHLSDGYKFNVIGIYFDELRNELNTSPSTDIFTESCLQPYEESMIESKTLGIPYADFIEVIFDNSSNTEEDCDVITFYTGSGNKTKLGSYSGKTFPGLGSTPPLIIEGNEFSYTWITDSSVGLYGWRFSYRAVQSRFQTYEAKEYSVVVESPHPLSPVMEKMIEINVPHATQDSIDIYFHPSSNLDFHPDFNRGDDNENTCVLEFFINPNPNPTPNPSSSSEAYDLNRMEQIGITYRGNKLPGITENPLRIPSKRCWIRYSVLCNSNRYPLDRNLFPYGFKMIAVPSEYLLPEYTPCSIHRRPLVLCEFGQSPSREVEEVVQNHLGSLVGMTNSHDYITSQYAVGILTNFSATTCRTILLSSSHWEDLSHSLEHFIYHEDQRTWGQFLTVRLLSNLCLKEEASGLIYQVDSSRIMMSGILTHIVYLWETCGDDFRAKITQDIKRVLLACMNMNVETIRQRTKLKLIDGLGGAAGGGLGRGLTDELPDADDLIIAILLEALKFRSPRLLKKLGTKVFETLNLSHEKSSDSSKKLQRIGLPPSMTRSRSKSIFSVTKCVYADLTEEMMNSFSLQLAHALEKFANLSRVTNSDSLAIDCHVKASHLPNLIKLLTLDVEGIQVPLLGTIIALMNDLDNVFALEKAAYDLPTLFRLIQSPIPAVRKLVLKFLQVVLQDQRISSSNLRMLQDMKKYLIGNSTMEKRMILTSPMTRGNYSDFTITPSWITPLSCDDQEQQQPLVFQYCAVSVDLSPQMNVIKGFVHDDLILDSLTSGLSISFWLDVFGDKDSSSGTLIYFGKGFRTGTMAIVLENLSLVVTLSSSLHQETYKGRSICRLKSLKSLKLDHWNFICLTLNVSSRSMSLFINNELQGESSYDEDLLESLPDVLRNPWYLGLVDDDSADLSSDLVSGKVDYFSIYRGCLSSDQRQLISQNLPHQLIGKELCYDSARHVIEEILTGFFRAYHQLVSRSSIEESSKEFELSHDLLIALGYLSDDSNIVKVLTDLELPSPQSSSTTISATATTPTTTTVSWICDLLSHLLDHLSSPRVSLTRADSYEEHSYSIEMSSSSHPYQGNRGTEVFKKLFILPHQSVEDFAFLLDSTLPETTSHASLTPLLSNSPSKSNLRSFDNQTNHQRTAMKIWFDQRTQTELNRDVLKIYEDETEQHLLASYSGNVLGTHGWPTFEEPLIVISSKVWVTFTTQSSNSRLWGWRMFATPTENPYEQRKLSPHHQILLSPGFPSIHYSSNLDLYETISLPGVESLEIAFHPNSSINRDGDYVTFYKNQTKRTFWGRKRYSGCCDNDLPSFRNPLVIPASSCYVHFHSDISCQEIGYELVASEAEKPQLNQQFHFIHGLLLLLKNMSSHNQNNFPFMKTIIGERCERINMFLKLLEVMQGNDVISNLTNELLYNIAGNMEALQLIIAHVTSKTTDSSLVTRRWLITVVAMLTSSLEWTQEVMYTDISPFPVIKESYMREFYFPLAREMTITFRHESSLPHHVELWLRGDPLRPEASKLYTSDSGWESFDVTGGHLSVSVMSGKSKYDELDIGTGYIFDVRTRYGEIFDADSTQVVRALGSSSLSIVLHGLRSSDEMTMLFASRAMANLFLCSQGEERKEILEIGIPKLLELLESESVPISSYEIFNKMPIPRSLVVNLIAKPSLISSSTERSGVYYEVTCMCIKGVHLGLTIPYSTRQSSQYLPPSMKARSQFGKDTAPFHFLFSLEHMTLKWMTTTTPLTHSRISVGDVIGFHLDLVFFKIRMFLNGIPLTTDGIAAFDSHRHGPSELWSCGLQPAVFFESEVPHPLAFNFGQQEFDYSNPMIHSSLLAVVRGMKKPLVISELRRWKTVHWKVYDSESAAADGYRLILDEDAMIQSRGQYRETQHRLVLNYKRQVSRGLSGVHPLQNHEVLACMNLLLSDDQDTVRWATKSLFGVLRHGSFHQTIFQDLEVTSKLFQICRQSTSLWNELCNSFVNSKPITDFLEEYVLSEVELPSPSEVLFESSHPYSENIHDIFEISFPEFNGIEITFDPATVTEECFDYVVFYRENPTHLDLSSRYSVQISDQFSGRYSDKWTGFLSSITFPYRRIWVEFITNDDTEFWGYRFIAKGVHEVTSQSFQTLCSENDSQVVASDHPALISEIKEIIVTTSLSHLLISFDPRTRFPEGSNLVFFLSHPESKIKRPVSYEIGSGGNIPGVGEFEPLVIEVLDNSLRKFEESERHISLWYRYNYNPDMSHPYWGYEFVVCPISTPRDPMEEILNDHPESVVIETNHPCLSHEKMGCRVSQAVKFPGASAIAVLFDPRSETRLLSNEEQQHQDFFESVIFLKSREGVDYDIANMSQYHAWVTNSTWQYGGGQKGKSNLMPANFPIDPKAPLIIPSDHFHVIFGSHRKRDNTLWGWRFVAYPIWNHEAEVSPFESLSSRPGAVIVDSDNLNSENKVLMKFEGTKLLALSFSEEDTDCQYEDSEFIVNVFSGRPSRPCIPARDRQALVGSYRCYPGRRFFPGIDNYPPLILSKPNLWLEILQPDHGYYQGRFKLVVAPYPDELVDWIGEDGEIFESAHPSGNLSERSFVIDFPGAVALEFIFDRRSILHSKESLMFLTSSRNYAILATYSSISNSSLPSLTHPLRIGVSSCTILYHSDPAEKTGGKENDETSSTPPPLTSLWGFRVAVRPIFPENLYQGLVLNKPFFTEMYERLRQSKLRMTIIESFCQILFLLTHNSSLVISRFVESEPDESTGGYKSDSELIGSVTFPLAQTIDIGFDQRTNTSVDRDFLHLFSRGEMRDEDYVYFNSEISRKPAAAIFSGPFNRPGSWNSIPLDQDRIFFRFNSEEVTSENLWGFRMTVTPSYEDFQHKPKGLRNDLLMDQRIFTSLHSLLCSKRCTSAGLALVNLIQPETFETAIELRGVNWFHDLLTAGSDDVVIATLNNLLAFHPSPLNIPHEKTIQSLKSSATIPIILPFLGHSNPEIRSLSLLFLRAVVKTTNGTAEEVMLKLLSFGDPSTSKLVLKLIPSFLSRNKPEGDDNKPLTVTRATTAHDSSSSNRSPLDEKFRSTLINLGAVDSLKKCLSNGIDSVSAVSALETLLQTENGMERFLENRYDTSSSLLPIFKMLTGSPEEIGSAIRFIEKFCHKHPDDFEKIESSYQADGTLNLFPHSLKILSETKPLWIEILSSPEERNEFFSTTPAGPLTLSKRISQSSTRSKPASSTLNKIKAKRKRRNPLEADKDLRSFTMAFWAYPCGYLNNDGLPLLYKGNFTGEFVSLKTTRTYLNNQLVRSGKVYYEVTFRSSGSNCMVSLSASSSLADPSRSRSC
jgi:hypothetical protein